MQLEDYFDFQRSVLCPCSHSQVSRDTGLRVLLVVPVAHQENPAGTIVKSLAVTDQDKTIAARQLLASVFPPYSGQ